MKINPILLQAHSDKLSEIYKDYFSVKSFFGSENNQGQSVFETIPIYSKTKDIPDKMTNKDYQCASALASLAVLSGPEEIGELFSAMKQIKSKFSGKPYDKPYDNKIAQHPFTFFQGTILRDYLNPYSKDCLFPKLASWLLKLDKSFIDTKLGGYICRKLGIEVENISTTIRSMTYTDELPNYIEAKVIKTNNPFKELIGRTMARTPVLGAAAIIGIGSMHTKHKIDDGGDPLKECVKTATTLGTTILGIGSLGALGAKHFGATGSLLGIAAGTYLGAEVSRLLG